MPTVSFGQSGHYSCHEAPILDLDVRAGLVPCIADFITNRQHSVKLTSGQDSDWEPTMCGVPEGTRIWSMLFLTMVNGIATETPHHWMHADDITVAVSSDIGALGKTPGLQHNKPRTRSVCELHITI